MRKSMKRLITLVMAILSLVGTGVLVAFAIGVIYIVIGEVLLSIVQLYLT